jgi:hypothetical protein
MHVINARIMGHFEFHLFTVCSVRLLLRVAPSERVDGFGGLVVSMLASGTQGRRFKPGRNRWIFTDVKILSMPSSGGDVKESVPCPSFAACKKS